MSPSKTRHANASKSTTFIEAGAVILAGVGVAFVDVDFATGSGEALGAIANERARGVDANAVVFAG